MSVVALASLIALQAPVTLTYHPKVGSNYKFSISSTIKGPNGSVSVSALSGVKVLSFTNGYYRVETKVSNVKNASNSPAAPTKDKVTILDYDVYGAVKVDPKTQSAGPNQVMNNFNNQALGMQFPRKPVKVGDTWTNSVDLGKLFSAFMKGASKAVGTVKLTFKLVQITPKTATITCAIKGAVDMHILSQAKGKAPQNVQVSLNMNGDGQYAVDRSTGVQETSNMKMEITTGSNGHHVSSSQTVSMKRI